MKNKKDKQLNDIFNEYITNSESPRKDVTSRAKLLLKHSEGDLPTKQNSLSPCLSSEKTTKPKFTFSFFVKIFSPLALASAVILCVAFLTPSFQTFLGEQGSQGGTGGNGDGSTSFSISDLKVAQPNSFEHLDFIPFVEKENVREYREYYPKETISDKVDAAKPILYFLNYESQFDPDVNLYVGHDYCTISDLDEYTEAQEKLSFDKITFHIKKDIDRSLVFFKYTGYQYNIEVDSLPSSNMNLFLKNIDDSF